MNNKYNSKKVNKILLFILAIGVLSYIIDQNKGPTLQETSNISSANEVFKPTEKLRFRLELGDEPDLSFNKDLFTSKVMAQQITTYEDENVTIDVKLISIAEEKEITANLEIQKENESTYIIEADSREIELVPGAYELQVQVEKQGETLTFTQDFSWGVLAINTNKSIYTPDETAILAMAVLDEKGEMVCDADVDLVITSPEGVKTTLSTKDQTIKISPNCFKKEYIPNPDYETKYKVGPLGNYEMQLTATTPNGTYTISDEFEVRDYVLFDVERTTATRIFPPVEYPVTLTIKANEDFYGTIQESIPSSFTVISDQLGFVIRDYGTTDSDSRLVQRAEYSPVPDLADITQDKNIKILSWDVDLKKGDELKIDYVYKAPEISPEFYLLGPIRFLEGSTRSNLDTPQDTSQGPTSYSNEIFREARQWQIAADAIAFVQQTAVNSANVTSVSTSLTASANSLVVVICSADGASAMGGTISGYTTVFVTSTSIPHGTYYKISAGATENPTCSWTGSGTGQIIILEYSGTETSAGYILDTSASATGSGDNTAECPSVTPSSGTHLYLASLAGEANTTVSSWSNTFTQRVNYNGGTGPPGNRHFSAAADKTTTGSQSTTATIGATTAWSCHMMAFNEDVDIWFGRVFTDDNETTTLNAQSVCGVINNGTPSCVNTDGSGYFVIATLDSASGDELTFFLDGGTNLGNTKTISDGGDIVTADNLRVYQNHVVLRHEQGTSISIVQMDSYDNDQNSTDMLYDAEDATPDTLSVESGIELFVQTGFTFAPGGNVTSVHDIEIDGTWTAATNETVNINGTYKLDTGGTLNPSTSTVTFDGTGGTENIITDGTGAFYNLTVNDGGGSLTLVVEDPLTVRNNLTITGGTLDVKSGENNQINVGGNWDNDDIFEPRTGTVVFDGSGATTYSIDADGVGTPDFFNITFNDSGGGSTYQLTTTADINGSVTITGGTFDSNGNNINVGGSWTNDDTFLEDTATVTFDEGGNVNLDSGCADEDTCTAENFYNLTIDKNEDAAVSLSNTHLRVTNLLSIVEGWLIQGALNIRSEGATAVQVHDFGRWLNLSTGNVTLGGNVLNDGNITLNGNGISCGDADDIVIASTTTSQRSWSGTGAFRLTDVAVSYMTGSAVIHVGSGTDSGNNGTNWTFVGCNIFEFEGLNFEGINID